jgi:hypothetical protein
MHALEAAILETAGIWEQEGIAGGEVREIIGAVDETFLERLMLIFADLPTGYLVLEEVADDRTYATWKAWVDERLTALRTGVLYLVSDRAQALIQLAEKGLGCLRASIMASATPFCFCTTQKHLSVKIVIISMA